MTVPPPWPHQRLKARWEKTTILLDEFCFQNGAIIQRRLPPTGSTLEDRGSMPCEKIQP